MQPPESTAARAPAHALLQRSTALLVLAATLILPLVGAWLAGSNLSALLRFPPPLEIPLHYPRWSWAAAIAIAALLGAIALSWANAVRKRRADSTAVPTRTLSSGRRLSWWGWAGIAWTASWWVCAWTRFAALAPIQRYTFVPLWLGFILVVNAIVEQRSGTCLMRRAPKDWLKLFTASAAFWWVFEWLNRFVHNWHYLGVQDFGAFAYAAHATLCFSTVLPAVAGAAELFGGFPRLQVVATRGPRWTWLGARPTGAVLLAGGAAALVFTGIAPGRFYPALWCAPLALGFGAGILGCRTGMWRELAQGDWRRTANWMLAACLCGGFWEMWNSHSAAKWIYTVPYVERWHVFEMPLLGYAGYLAFGLECGLVVEQVLAHRKHSTPSGDPIAKMRLEHREG